MTTGSVTLHGANGEPVATTGNSYASAHAAMFQSLTAVVASSGINTLAGNTNIVIQNGFGDVGVIAGGTGSDTSVVLVGDSTNLAFIGGSANTTLVGGNGSDSIIAGSGNNTIALGAGTDQVFLGTGSSAVSVAGSNDFIQAGGGSASIVLTGTGATVNGGYNGPLTIDDTQGTSSTLNVVNNTTVNVSSISVTTINAYGDTTVDGGSGSQAVYAQNNGVLKFVGTGGSISVLGGPAAGNDTLYAAGGSTSIVLQSNTPDNIFVANDTTYGASGTAYFDGSGANGGNQFWAGSGNATLLGGTGGDTMVAGAGNVTMTGGGTTSTNYFDLFSSTTTLANTVTVTDFLTDPSNKLTLFNFGPSAAAQFIAGATSAGGNTSYVLSDGTTVNLLGVNKSILSSSNVLST